MATILNDPLPIRTRRGKMDADGYREYYGTWLVFSNSPFDGPSQVLATPGLPTTSDVWAYGNDFDSWAFATLERSVKSLEELGPTEYWEIEIKFSTKGNQKRCKDQQIDDPLLMADRISGGSHKYTEEARTDRFGNPITNSAYEQIRGQQVEFDANRFTVTVEQNVIDLQLFLMSTIVNCLNDSTLWGLPRRKIKFSDFDFSVKYYGNCYKYYTRKLTFDVDPAGFDKDLLDEGTKALHGQWGNDGHWSTIKIGGQNPNPTNPAHYSAVLDRKGSPMKVILDGRGLPFDDAPTIVTGCGQCGTGTPAGTGSVQTFTAKGYVQSGSGSAATYTAVSFDLIYSTGCTWTGTYGGQAYTLTYTAPNWVLSTSGGLGSVSYTLAGTSWNCLNTNVMAGTAPGTTSFPGSWTIYVKRTAVGPGSRHVEKYQEANFLALGIPTSL